MFGLGDSVGCILVLRHTTPHSSKLQFALHSCKRRACKKCDRARSQESSRNFRRPNKIQNKECKKKAYRG